MPPTKGKSSLKAKKVTANGAPKAPRSRSQGRVAKAATATPSSRPVRGPGGRFLKRAVTPVLSEAEVSLRRRGRPLTPENPSANPPVQSSPPPAEPLSTTPAAPLTTIPEPPTVAEQPPTITTDGEPEVVDTGVRTAQSPVPGPVRRKAQQGQRKARRAPYSQHHACYPRRVGLDPAYADSLRAKWNTRWSEKPPSGAILEEQLRAEFFKTSASSPRCYSCKISGRVMPSGEAKPDGTEERELLPCGCLYEAALLEMWAVKKGLFVDSEIAREAAAANNEWTDHLGPVTFGRHKLLLLRFWEMIFGPFNPAVMFNLAGQRSQALAKFSEEEEVANARLASNPGFVKLVSYKDIGRIRRPRKPKVSAPQGINLRQVTNADTD